MVNALRALIKFNIIVGLTMLFSISSFAMTGVEDYYVVQTNVEDIKVSIRGLKTPVKLTLHRGQIIKLKSKPFSDLQTIEIEKTVNGKKVMTPFAFRSAQVKRLFGSPISPNNKLPDQYLAERPTIEGGLLRLDKNPETLGTTPANSGAGAANEVKFLPSSDFPVQTESGRTQISVKESRIVDVGTNGKEHFVLTHNICLKRELHFDECGWVRNDFLSRGDTTNFRYNFYPADVDHVDLNVIIEPPCPNRDSLGRASELATHALQAIAKLPQTEQMARDQIRDAIGACAVNPPGLPSWKLPTQSLNKKDTNLYEGLGHETAVHSFEKVTSAAARVVVRDGSPANNHSLSKEEFITIDAFARTLFAEMRGAACSTRPYMEATARTIINRANHPSAARFRKNVGSAKNPILQAIVSNRAYSVWNNDDEITGSSGAARTEIEKFQAAKAKALAVSQAAAKRVAALNTKNAALAKKKGQKFKPQVYVPPPFKDTRSGEQISRDNKLANHLQNTKDAMCPSATKGGDQEAWQHAIDVAMHAVLDEGTFNKETESIAGFRYYTSSFDYDHGYTPLRAPVLAGQSLNNPACMKFWKANDE